MARPRLHDLVLDPGDGPPPSWLARKSATRAALQFAGQSDAYAERLAYWEDRYRRQFAGYGDQLKSAIWKQEAQPLEGEHHHDNDQ